MNKDFNSIFNHLFIKETWKSLFKALNQLP